MDIPAVILAGGKGTRLQSLYADRPKALAPVAGKPFIEHQVQWLRRNGISRIVIAAGYLADQLQQWADANGAAVEVLVEPQPLGTGGAVRFAAESFADRRFYVLNGDSLCPALDFQTLETVLQGLENASKRLGVLSVAPIEDAGRYGTVEFDENGLISAFREKARRQAGWINAGVYLLDRAVLDFIPDGQMVSMEHEVFPRLAESNRLIAVPCDPPLLDMGTPDGLKRMEAYIQQAD